MGNIKIGEEIKNLGLNKEELKEVREKIISLYGKGWSELMLATEIERSLYSAYVTKGKEILKEEQFNEWKKEKIELYERAGKMSTDIAAVLENKELSEEQKKLEVEKIIKADKDAAVMFTERIRQEHPGVFKKDYLGCLYRYITKDFVSQGESTESASTKANNLVYQEYLTNPEINQQLDQQYKTKVWSAMLSSMKPEELSGYATTLSQSSNNLNSLSYDKSAIKTKTVLGYALGMMALPEVKKQADEELKLLREQSKKGE